MTVIVAGTLPLLVTVTATVALPPASRPAVPTTALIRRTGTVICCVSAALTLAAKEGFAANEAVIRCEPSLSRAVENTACPCMFMLAVPRTIPPSEKVTTPVGVTPVAEVTAAVNVTGWPKAEGLALLASIVVVAAGFTVCVSAADLLAALARSPL